MYLESVAVYHKIREYFDPAFDMNPDPAFFCTLTEMLNNFFSTTAELIVYWKKHYFSLKPNEAFFNIYIFKLTNALL